MLSPLDPFHAPHHVQSTLPLTGAADDPARGPALIPPHVCTCRQEQFQTTSHPHINYLQCPNIMGTSTSTSSSSSSSTDTTIFPLLSLPLEIRLQIYAYILLSHPAHHSHLSPHHIPAHCTTLSPYLKSLGQLSASPTSAPRPLSSLSSNPLIPSSQRGHGCGHIPKSLLRSCHQIHHEASLLPFERNEFVFVNWFSSGLYAARCFLRALKPWQRRAMRYARVEVLKRDLENSYVVGLGGARPGTEEWRDLCMLWCGSEGAPGEKDEGECGGGEKGTGGGLWGLRLGIMGKLGEEFVPKSRATGGGSMGLGSSIDAISAQELQSKELLRLAADYAVAVRADQRGILGVEKPWVIDGLARLKALRWLEIEIEDEAIEKELKVAFCEALEWKLNELRRLESGEEHLRVVVVKVDRAVVKQTVCGDKPMSMAAATAAHMGDASVAAAWYGIAVR